MIRVQLAIAGLANRLTLKAILEARGFEIVEAGPDVVITDGPDRALEFAQHGAALLLAPAAEVRNAVACMRKGVFGYLFVPMQPGEAEIMVQRAHEYHTQQAAQHTPEPGFAPVSLEQAEERHILDTVRHCKGNRTQAAKLLGIGRNTLWRKLRAIEERRGKGTPGS